MKPKVSVLFFSPSNNDWNVVISSLTNTISNLTISQTSDVSEFESYINKNKHECVVIYDGNNDTNKIDEIIELLNNYTGDVVLATEDKQKIGSYESTVTDYIFVNNNFGAISRRIEQLCSLYQQRKESIHISLHHIIKNIINYTEDYENYERFLHYLTNNTVSKIDSCGYSWVGYVDSNEEMNLIYEESEDDNTVWKDIDIGNVIPLDELFEDSTSYVIGDIDSCDNIPASVKEDTNDLLCSSLVAIPLMYKDNKYGVLFMHFTDNICRDKYTIDLINLLGQVVSMSIFTIEQQVMMDELSNEVETLEQRINQFMSVMSHDLRNPLNTAQGYTDLYKTQKDEKYLEWVEKAHSRIEQLITDMLTLLREGKTMNKTEDVELQDIVDLSWKSVQNEDVELNKLCNQTVSLNKDRCQRMFEILFKNSVQHAGTDITITVGDINEDGKTGFYVSDDGVGLPDVNSKDIFEHGYSTKNDGTGLGLTIVELIVESHGWTIEANKEKAEGARFDIIVSEGNG